MDSNISKISFKQYYDSKQKLKSAGEDCPKYFKEYFVNRYCKLPLLDEMESIEKTYLALKPKDKIEIFWEVTDLVHPIPKFIKVIQEDCPIRKYYFSWNLEKINKWLNLSTFSSQKE